MSQEPSSHSHPLGHRRSTYVVAFWLWIRLSGIVYLIAFWSLGVQIIGLVGHDGILPAADYMVRARAVLTGIDRFRLLPTLAWIGASDAFLRGLCIAGAALAALGPYSPVLSLAPASSR